MNTPSSTPPGRFPARAPFIPSSSRALQVPFGLRDDTLYEPLQVEGGLKCGCTCPGCGARLVARHSPSGRVASNFAHYASDGCASGFETAVHRAAKQLISSRLELFLPGVLARAPELGYRGEACNRQKLLSPAGLRYLQAVRIEEGLGRIRPDLIVEIEQQDVLVEIAVTHFVDDVKLARIQELGVPAVEIDVSALREMSFAALENALFTDAQKSRWVWHPGRELEWARLQALVDEDLAGEPKCWAQGESLSLFEGTEEAVAGRAEVLWRREIAQHKTPKHRARTGEGQWSVAEFRDAPEPEKLRKVLLQMGANEDQLRVFLPVPVPPIRAIAAAPLVWQAAVFSGLIHRALRWSAADLTSETVRTWIRQRFNVIGDEKALGVTVWQFLSGLEKLKVLHHLGQQRFLVVVTEFATARAVVADALEGGVVPLAWVTEWPQDDAAKLLADAFGRMFGDTEKWRNVAGLLKEVRAQEAPEDSVLYYAAKGLHASAVRRFFLAAGFVRLAGT